MHQCFLVLADHESLPSSLVYNRAVVLVLVGWVGVMVMVVLANHESLPSSLVYNRAVVLVLLGWVVQS
jgi:phosphate starvation-inducible membrane PsiE